MSEGGPSASELGIAQEDLRVEEKKESTKVVLPDPPEGKIKIFGERKQITGGVTVKNGEEVPYTFQREQELPPQEQFSDKVKNMILAPIRGELDNGNLANFLRQLNEQKGFDSQDKLGLVLLINDNAKDRAEGKHVVDENRIVSRYVSLLGAKDIESIGQIDIPQEYKDLAKDIIEKDKLEIRQDFLHSEDETPHFGLLRSHLFKEAEAFKNSSLPYSDVILHLSDADTTYTSRHFEKLKNFYSDPSHQANLTEQDFLPGVHEGAKEEDISRDLLTHMDEFRRYRYEMDVVKFLFGEVDSGTPIISGRLSYFENKKLDDGPRGDRLSDYDTNEDYFIGKRMREGPLQFGNAVGNVGEVYREHRARDVEDYPFNVARTDAQEAFSVIKRLQEGKRIASISNGEESLDASEKHVAQAKNKENPEDTQSENFKESEEYRELLRTELAKEQAKVRMRRLRLMNYVDSLAGKGELREGDQKIVDPYLEYFQDETDEMKKQLTEGKTSEQVSVSYLHKYDSFFNPDTPIHTQIARVRALKKYVFAHDLSRPIN
jgi:hypothetical protein